MMDAIEARADDAARLALVGALDNPEGFSVAAFITREWQDVTEDERERFLGNLASALVIRCAGALLAVEQLALKLIDPATGRQLDFDVVATVMRDQQQEAVDDPDADHGPWRD